MKDKPSGDTQAVLGMLEQLIDAKLEHPPPNPSGLGEHYYRMYVSGRREAYSDVMSIIRKIRKGEV